MALTVKDVARAANVSPATVSLVLNGRAGISDETRARVLMAASDLNYAPRGARAGRAERPPTVRFLKISLHGHTVNRDHNTFISDYIDGMSAQAGECGYQLEVVSHEGRPMAEVVASLAGAELSGVIALGTELAEHDVQLLQGAARPLVVIDTFFDGVECDFVNMNNRDAVFKSVALLAGRGFDRIGFIASPVQTLNFRLRREAFFEALTAHGLVARADAIVTVDSTYEGAYHDMLAALATGREVPQCYVCTNDVITYGCIKALRKRGLRVPQDVSIVGFDNLPMSATMDPPLTTIDVSKRKIGSLAVTLLDEQIRSRERQPAVKVLVGAELVTRDSVAARPLRAGARPARSGAGEAPRKRGADAEATVDAAGSSARLGTGRAGVA